MPNRTTVPERIHQLKVTLKGSKPPIWRRLEIADTATLAKLHQILQIAMGWSDSHLHQFEIAGISYGALDPEYADEMLDERKVKLKQILRTEKQVLMYEYDFGDSWEHQVVLEKIIELDPTVAYPRCTAGKRACPPEDCGGIWGFADLLEAIADENHPEHEEILEWVGEEFNPQEFDTAAVNRALQRIR